MKRIACILLICLLPASACATAELRMDDSGNEAAALQQMLFEMGFLFAEPDGMLGKQTEEAVKWFQEYAGLEPNTLYGK